MKFLSSSSLAQQLESASVVRRTTATDFLHYSAPNELAAVVTGWMAVVFHGEGDGFPTADVGDVVSVSPTCEN